MCKCRPGQRTVLGPRWPYLGHAAHPSHQQHLPDVPLGDLGVLHGLLAGGHGAADQVPHDALELGAAQLDVEMLGSGGVHGQVGQVDVRLGGERRCGGVAVRSGSTGTTGLAVVSTRGRTLSRSSTLQD